MHYVIRTPENVTFGFEVAGVAVRGVAWCIDMCVMGALVFTAAQLVGTLSSVTGGFADALLFVAVFSVQWWYAALLEWGWGGQTIGKRLCGIRTISEQGVGVSFVQAVVRNLVRVVDLLPGLYLVGGLSALLDRHGRRLGDLAAGTLVVHERRAWVPASIVPPSERYEGFVDDPAVRLAMRRVTAPERDVMVRLSHRREQLPLDTRRALFDRLAAHLEMRLGLERPAHLTSEKFVLNLTFVVLDER